MFPDGVAVSHSCQVIADYPRPTIPAGAIPGEFTKLAWTFAEMMKHFLQQTAGLLVRFMNHWIEVEIPVKITA